MGRLQGDKNWQVTESRSLVLTRNPFRLGSRELIARARRYKKPYVPIASRDQQLLARQFN